MTLFSESHINDHWILSHRGKKNKVDPFLPYAWLHEKEFFAGKLEDVATIFLTNRECSYHCLMCDLWKNTTDKTVAPGSIPAQIKYALDRLPEAKHLKLYNSGNFFDKNAIPKEDYTAIAELVRDFDTVILENHPKRLGDSCLEFNRLTRPGLQVGMGLETVHPRVLEKLNKRMSLDDFKQAVFFLKENGIQSRAFILIKPPFMDEKEGIHWAKKSIDFAFQCGVDICAVIPTRAGNGSMEILQEEGFFSPPEIGAIEEVLEYGIGLGKGAVFADLWDLKKFSECENCLDARQSRLDKMNLKQEIPPAITCHCS